jgi:hypothetical protein
MGQITTQAALKLQESNSPWRVKRLSSPAPLTERAAARRLCEAGENVVVLGQSESKTTAVATD